MRTASLVTGSLMDYAVPKAPMLPTIETDRTVTPTLLNPLGAKGIGEAGTIGSAPAVANAIIDALAPFGVTHLEMPLNRKSSGGSCTRAHKHERGIGIPEQPSSASQRESVPARNAPAYSLKLSSES